MPHAAQTFGLHLDLAIQDFLSLLLRWLFDRSLSSHNGLLFSALSRLDQCVSVGMDPTQFAHIQGLVSQETSMPVLLFCSNTVPGFLELIMLRFCLH